MFTDEVDEMNIDLDIDDEVINYLTYNLYPVNNYFYHLMTVLTIYSFYPGKIPLFFIS